MLREYQQRAIDQLYAWFEAGGRGNPCLVLHDGYAGQKAMRQLMTMANSSGAHLAEAAHMEGSEGLEYLAVQMSNSKPPTSIEYRLDGKFHRVLKRSWS